jgi:hypothetical protein
MEWGEWMDNTDDSSEEGWSAGLGGGARSAGGARVPDLEGPRCIRCPNMATRYCVGSHMPPHDEECTNLLCGSCWYTPDGIFESSYPNDLWGDVSVRASDRKRNTLSSICCGLCGTQPCAHCGGALGDPDCPCPDGCGLLCSPRRFGTGYCCLPVWKPCALICNVYGCGAMLRHTVPKWHLLPRACSEDNTILWIILCAAARAVGPLPTDMWLLIAKQMYVSIKSEWILPSRVG